MIAPIRPRDPEYHKTNAQYGVTKFIGDDGDGYRAVIVEYLDDEHTRARAVAVNGPYTGATLTLIETDPKKWPIVGHYEMP